MGTGAICCLSICAAVERLGACMKLVHARFEGKATGWTEVVEKG
jgi:hypothetical protein